MLAYRLSTHSKGNEDGTPCPTVVALSLADSFTEKGPAVPLVDVNSTISLVRLFDWALRCGHEALVALMISEEAAWGVSRPWQSPFYPVRGDDWPAPSEWPTRTDWPWVSETITQEIGGLLIILDLWNNRDLVHAVLESSHKGVNDPRYEVATVLFAAEVGLPSIAQSLLLDIRHNHELYRRLIVESIRRGCICSEKNLVQALIRTAFEQTVASGLYHAALNQALDYDAFMLADLVLGENAATRGPFVNGMTLTHFAKHEMTLTRFAKQFQKPGLGEDPGVGRRVLTMSFDIKGAWERSGLDKRRAKATLMFELEDESLIFLANETIVERTHNLLEGPYRGDGCKDFLVLTPALDAQPIPWDVKGPVDLNHCLQALPKTIFSIEILFYGYEDTADQQLLLWCGELLQDILSQMDLSSLKHQLSANGQFDVPSLREIEDLVPKITSDHATMLVALQQTLSRLSFPPRSERYGLQYSSGAPR